MTKGDGHDSLTKDMSVPPSKPLPRVPSSPRSVGSTSQTSAGRSKEYKSLMLKRSDGPPGSKCGIGITFWKTYPVGPFTIAALKEHGPAAASCLVHPGDLLHAVDQISVYEKVPDEVTQMIIGEPKSTVELLISCSHGTADTPQEEQGPGYNVAAEITGMNREYMSPRSVESKLRKDRASPRREEERREDDFSPWSSREHLEKEEEAIEVFKEKLDQVFKELEKERRRIDELNKERNASMAKIQAQAAAIRGLKGDKEMLTARVERLQADLRDQEVMTTKLKDVEMHLEGSKKKSADLTRKLEEAEKKLLSMQSQSGQARDVQRQLDQVMLEKRQLEESMLKMQQGEKMLLESSRQAIEELSKQHSRDTRDANDKVQNLQDELKVVRRIATLRAMRIAILQQQLEELTSKSNPENVRAKEDKIAQLEESISNIRDEKRSEQERLNTSLQQANSKLARLQLENRRLHRLLEKRLDMEENSDESSKKDSKTTSSSKSRGEVRPEPQPTPPPPALDMTRRSLDGSSNNHKSSSTKKWSQVKKRA
ncbi:hypothetical protein GUITHDRAFT_136297 [Guillardia theta CCMP2712]|uniref:PDZ domain-containing protein n=1 Tax=Guillardia theta (strain CCMP2712) TaxID=905079 RepID=L1JKV9_GUITC|nr:hypothetical protein GUITHDRAFT_136297 [Guillardia theta CCMP2712]EKX49133.1 hypothetical protein GUITHDRAFT_136297 [Guillardia theta CCMP2712]|eukprot:XP_005836113.1 hypothetical protein GUITHDRAFT_136297 [Guillardia theta CCMP2712]